VTQDQVQKTHRKRRSHEIVDRTGAPATKAVKLLCERPSPAASANSEMQEAGPVLLRLNQMLDEQSRRFAHALHDEAGQLLAAVHIRLAQAAQELPPQCSPCFREIRVMLEEIEGHLRNLSHELHPKVLDDLGLLPAIEVLADRVAKRTRLRITLDGSSEERLPAEVKTAVYRVVQESLNNVAKHARAEHVWIRTWEDGQLHCSVRDDGVGFVLEEVLARKGDRGLGLLGIQERVKAVSGSVSITSCPGGGTELLLTIPIEDQVCRLA
jgi:signal transduction histidine kinase